MCTLLTAAVFTRNDSTGSLSRRPGTPHVLFAQRLLAGPVPLRQSGSVLDLVIAHAEVFTLQEVTRQSGASISAAFAGCGWIPGGGVKKKSDSGRGQACSKFQHGGGLQNLPFILGISESPITTLSDPRGHHAFTHALLLAGLELPCDAGRLQCRSSTKRGERRGGIASGPEVDASLLLVGGESAAGLPPALVDVCRARHGPLFWSICRGLFLVG